MDQVKGYVDHIIYRNASNGYTVLNLICDSDEITCVGSFQVIEVGEYIEITGSAVEHAVYGTQLKMENYRVIPPDDIVSIERYLKSGAIKGIGPAIATKIIKKFKADTFRIMEEEPERLVEIKGISERIAREIASQMEEKKGLREAMVFLQNYGISNALSLKIYNQYGTRVYQVMKENPYLLAEDIQGVGFKIADEIATKAGIRTDSDFRIRSGILYTMLLASGDGHVYLPQTTLVERCSELLSVSETGIETQIMNLAMEKKLIIKKEKEQNLCYAASYYYLELTCAKMLCDLNIPIEFSEGMMPSEEMNIRKKIERLENELGIALDELQRKSVIESIKNGVFLLSGGPGTGKTTTINTMIRYFELEGLDIMLAAPTGRAAKRMTEATGFEARTIHRLLELNGAFEDDRGKAKFERNEQNPLETDVIIIDEMSMVDIHLCTSLLKAISVGTRVILVGDVNQLPSVGPGQVLNDLISSQQFPLVVLEKIFRQAGESDIVVNAHKINEGEKFPLINIKSQDFFFLQRMDVNVIYKHMIQLIRDKLPSYIQATSMDIQVLTPMRKGNLGVETLNQILQKYLNPEALEKTEYEYVNGIFRVGDKVMQKKNNYQLEWEIVSKYNIPIDKGLGVFNGDMGIIAEINLQAQTMLVIYDECKRITYPFSGLDEIELAYAITIHKSQGSEYPAVIMPLLSGPRQLFSRNLLYTGVTRAKKCVTILGNSDTIFKMIENTNENKRYTSLDRRIREVEGMTCL